MPSYGGAEVLRARRVLQTGEGPPVHLALYGEAPLKQLGPRLVAVAEASVQAAHDQVGRMLEVGQSEGSLYAVAQPVDGVELGAVLELERRRRGAPDPAFSMATALQLAQLAAELHERGDVWAAEGGAGLSSMFPAGIRLDALVLAPDGRLLVRVLAGAAADPTRPSAFRAPEVRTQRPTLASDVFLVAQVLRALLSGDPTATGAPKLPAAAQGLGPALAASLAPGPDERLGLFTLVEKLGSELVNLAGKTKPAGVVASFLKREYRTLVPDDAPDPPAASVATALRARLKQARAGLEVLWPLPSVSTPEPDTLPPATDFTPRSMFPNSGDVSRVFEDGDPDTVLEVPRVTSAPVLDVAARTLADEITTGTRNELARAEQTAEGEPPWISMSGDFALIPKSAPPITPSQIEAAPTKEIPQFTGSSGTTPTPKDKEAKRKRKR